MLDGSLARLQNLVHLGTMLDILSDHFVESFIIIAIFINQPQIWFGLLMIISIIVCISSFLLVGVFKSKRINKEFLL